MDALVILTGLALIFLLGLICTWLSDKLNISNILFLMIVGIIIGQIPYKGRYLIELPELFLTSLSILALVMIVFDSTSRFNLREFDSLSASALKLSLILILLNILLLSSAAYFLFGMNTFFFALIFSVIVAGTDPAAVLVMFQGKFHKVAELLKVESLINTPLIVILPFLILELQSSIKISPDVLTTIINQISPFVSKFVVGIGAGVLVGIIIFKLMRRGYDEHLSPLTLIAAALLTYILAENLQGSGVLAVTTLGLFFGNVYMVGKKKLTEFSSTFSNALEIIVFVMVGLIIKLPFSYVFFLKSILLFFIYLIIRYFSIEITFHNRFKLKEKIFMTLTGSKGIAVAVLVFILAGYALPGMKVILDLILVFLLYSIFVSTITVKFSKYFLTLRESKTK